MENLDETPHERLRHASAFSLAEWKEDYFVKVLRVEDSTALIRGEAKRLVHGLILETCNNTRQLETKSVYEPLSPSISMNHAQWSCHDCTCMSYV